MLRTGWVVVRRMVRVSSPPRSMVMVSSATWTVTICPAWIRPRAIFCPATMITPVLLARRWTVTGSAEGRGGGPAGRAPRRRPGLVPGQRAGPGAQQHAGIGVEEHQRVLLDADGDQLPPRISAAMEYRPPRLTCAVLADHAVDLDRRSGLARRGWGGGPAARPPLAASRARSAVDRWERTDLTRAPAMVRWMTSTLAQKVTVIPERVVPSQNCLPRTSMFPLGGTTRSNSTGPPCQAGLGRMRPGHRLRVPRREQAARAITAGSRSGSRSSSARAAAVLNRSAGAAMPMA